MYTCRLIRVKQTISKRVPIGKAINNRSIYILNEALQLLPDGEIGELFIGGTCLSRGYLNEPDLTQASFIQNPFSQNQKEKMYKTGDLARQFSDGTIEYMGRADRQDQIRGYRVELDEIELTLKKLPAIKEAAVISHGTGMHKKLIAYIVPDQKNVDEKSNDNLISECRNFIIKKLPRQMLPDFFIPLTQIPQTPNGKIDRLSLPAPGDWEQYKNKTLDSGVKKQTKKTSANQWIEHLKTINYNSSLKTITTKISEEFKAVIDMKSSLDIDLEKGFFDLGMNSLAAIEFTDRLQTMFNHDFSGTLLFDYPSFKTLTNYLANNEFKEVLAPKVKGLLNLDEASINQPLDFFIFFSSESGSMGNAGQSDYACANSFMDTYAEYRKTLVKTDKRKGYTLSINWPLWKDGGMHIDAEAERIMTQTTGMIPMRKETGIRILHQSLGFSTCQIMPMEGLIHQMKETISKTSVTAQLKKSNTNKSIKNELLQEKTSRFLKEILSSVTKLPVHRMQSEALLEQYGINSIMAMQLTGKLEKLFGSLSKTLFFEYRSIKELAEYFLSSHTDKLLEILKFKNVKDVKTEPDNQLKHEKKNQSFL